MKKILMLFVSVMAIAILSVSNQSAKNNTAALYVIPVALKDLNVRNNPDMSKSKIDLETPEQKIPPESEQRILHLLYNDTGLAKWSPSLWWSYQPGRTKKEGC